MTRDKRKEAQVTDYDSGKIAAQGEALGIDEWNRMYVETTHALYLPYRRV